MQKPGSVIVFLTHSDSGYSMPKCNFHEPDRVAPADQDINCVSSSVRSMQSGFRDGLVVLWRSESTRWIEWFSKLFADQLELLKKRRIHLTAPGPSAFELINCEVFGKILIHIIYSKKQWRCREQEFTPS